MIDVLIIGSGAAGLTAALNAKKDNSNVLVISKTYPTHSQTVQAQGGINAVLHEDDDSVDIHVEDTYKASLGLAHKDNINFMCKTAKETILWLDSIGVPFTRNEKDEISQRKFGGTKKIRTCYSSDYTGLKIVHTLYDQCIKENVEFRNEHQLLNLIVQNGKCLGVTVLDITTGEIKEFSAKTTIIASGGYAGIYTNFTTNSYANTGDGIASAYKAGAILSNMEFVQFHPTALVGCNILVSESARGEGGYLLDDKGKRFIDELEARDKVARAIFTKIQNKEQVFLDLRHISSDIINTLMPQEKKLALEFSNIDIEKELLPINPAAHYTMGGIKTDIKSQTNIENLYSCGEAAQASIHGANRLGGNSLLEIITFGKIAGLSASRKSKEMEKVTLENSNQLNEDKLFIEECYKNKTSESFYQHKDELGNILFKNVGLFRDKEKLTQALNDINKIKSNFSKMGIEDKSTYYNKNLVEFIEFRNMIEVSQIVIESALNRKESRGAHFRVDYPNIDTEYEKETLIKKDSDSMNICLGVVNED